MARPPSTAPPSSPPVRKRAATGPKPKKTRGKAKKKPPPKNLLQSITFLGLEWSGLTVIGIAAIILLLGHFANRFSGTDVMGSLLPFAGGIFAFIVLVTLLLIGWGRLRRWLLDRWFPWLPPAIVAGLALLAGFLVPQDYFTRAFGYYRTLVGGKEEAGRVTLAHQVYAAYRRLDTAQLKKMIDRAGQYAGSIDEAAVAYGVDPDLLMGLAATESSFMPRKSQDGGHGLFQITQAPAAAVEAVNRRFPADGRSLEDPRYNAFVGAATLRHYLTDMKNDLFLGLLAYNIGPANGGLRFIMQQYGVTDFITIQPYLLQLPRDYPIRVLSYSLAFRINRREGRPLAYEEGTNALHIQGMGIPGLADDWRPVAARPGS
ncbi:MAG: transglycosylase [Desulfobacterales bacterium GWB2_56_26]|nr:MAG: transglycosylase [Desulfobacterales bacterium GWB2_56_26]